ncbi:MAG: aspartyl-phosphate phosphatase Spo0E family protein [Clostridia bacterium]|nr:aspartyl-phosphate phosphatase Spo0E family protein [Clostridia bacterium]
MKAGDLKRIIDKKKRELVQLVAKKQSFLDQEVYAKSCELDSLVVRYMKLKLSNK